MIAEGTGAGERAHDELDGHFVYFVNKIGTAFAGLPMGGGFRMMSCALSSLKAVNLLNEYIPLFPWWAERLLPRTRADTRNTNSAQSGKFAALPPSGQSSVGWGRLGSGHHQLRVFRTEHLVSPLSGTPAVRTTCVPSPRQRSRPLECRGAASEFARRPRAEMPFAQISMVPTACSKSLPDGCVNSTSGLPLRRRRGWPGMKPPTGRGNPDAARPREGNT